MQLLISVKNVEEALLAMQTGADFIDLKDPSVGALTALNMAESETIVRAINGRARVSGTVGEAHDSVQNLAIDIQARVDLDFYAIKICVTPLFAETDFISEMRKFTTNGVRLIAIFFADSELNLGLLAILKQAEFYGAMLDTQKKQLSLLDLQPQQALKKFVMLCEQNNLVSGLAGALRPQHVDILSEMKPTFIGFRGGVCDNFVRQSSLSPVKIVEVKNMLLKHNKFSIKAQKSMSLALHS